MNRQGNTYTIIYSIVLVAIVGVLLSVVYQALRPEQVKNIEDDTKRQILSAALIPTEGQDVAKIYDEHIKSAFLVNSKGDRLDGDAFQTTRSIAQEVKKPADERLLPVFECETPKGVKYIVPVYGAGLWGPIWGYVAFDTNGDTIYGAYFAHQGETPGLGAEIEKPWFRDQFEDKNIFSSTGAFESVKVVKAGKEPKDGRAFVHAVSGGTITSQGVEKMLQNSLEPYTAYFKKLSENKEAAK